MSIINKIIQTLAVLVTMVIPLSLSADIVPAPLGSGSENAPGVGGISWDITQNGNAYTYTYTIVSGDASAMLLWMELNPIVTNSNFSTYVTGITGTAGQGGIGSSTPMGNLYSQEYFLNYNSNQSGATFSFNSTLAPIFGSFYWQAEFGSAIGYNSQFGVAPLSTDTLGQLQAGWVPVVGVVATPEPSTLLLIGSGLAASVFLKARKNKLQMA